jgi:hypothetical protein
MHRRRPSDKSTRCALFENSGNEGGVRTVASTHGALLFDMPEIMLLVLRGKSYPLSFRCLFFELQLPFWGIKKRIRSRHDNRE